MRYLKSFQEFENNESLKSNILAGAIGLGTVLGGSKAYSQDNKTKEQTYITKSKNDMLNHKYNGWKLDTTLIDTVFYELKKNQPETNIFSYEFIINDSSYYNSGKYNFPKEYELELNKLLDSLKNYTIVDVVIETSTDKQPLSINLKKDLISKGFEGNNKGLSDARCFYVGDYISKKIDKELIKKNIKFEQGAAQISSKDRYVKIVFNCLKVEVIQYPASDEIKYKLEPKYRLIKDEDYNKNVHKIKHNNIKSRELYIPIIKFKRNNKLKCYFEN